MNSNIQPHRMASIILRISGSNGSALKHQDVVVRQVRHKFLFGTAAFDLVPLTNGEYEGEARERAEERARALTSLFNAATLPFYWARFEPERGQPMTEQLKNAARWCLDHGLSAKGHPLCWHTLTADWLLSLDDLSVLAEQTARIRREVAGFRGLIDTWDVINEGVIMPIFAKYDNGITRLCKHRGRVALIRSMFEAARATNPSATLLINDFDVSPAYDILVEACLEAGVQIDAIGIQSHMHQGYWGVEKTLKVLDQFSRFRLPIHFTETTLVSGRLMPPDIVDLNDYQVNDWPTTRAGEERQAEEAVQHYKTLFGHPLVQGITWWDMVDGGWLNSPGGLVRRDGSTKPAYEELLRLIKQDWWVSPTTLTTDQNGEILLTGVLGEYEVTCRGERRSFSLNQSDGQAVEIHL
ncbi:MAG TPA: endo-1,4-beta-xylanase [Anaerolineales bacterium]|nr:endo-1,4-beta-xylanase [Anaerolineales bacterium]